jgi:hypothetical protein
MGDNVLAFKVRQKLCPFSFPFRLTDQTLEELWFSFSSDFDNVHSRLNTRTVPVVL